ncbi:MAG: nucleoside kinase [Spirochaetaceae bacterium]|jgi:uridine kinase|nr:nucleoside kinase [Spirochaetaceae bacterium]
MKQICVTFTQTQKKIQCNCGTEISELSANFGEAKALCVAAYVNNKARPLSYPLGLNATVCPILINSKEGAQIYRQTLAYLLIKASHTVLKHKEIYMGHSLGNAYYYTVTHGEKLSQEEIRALKTEIQSLVRVDLSIEYGKMTFEDAVKYFTEKNLNQTVQLLNQRCRSEIPVNRCGDFVGIYARPLLHKTGIIKAFDLVPYDEGFLLLFPCETDITKLNKFTDNPKIFSVYYEYKKWGRIVGLHTAASVNKLIADRTIRDFIRINEAFQTKKLADIAEKICANKENIKLILIAGPSSSGKTTTAKRLSIQLQMLGINPIAVSLDDYYQHPSKAPKDEFGKPDLECLEALDVPYLNQQLLTLFSGDEVVLPVFDFKTSTRKDGKKIHLTENDVLVLEGIHGLNDELTPQIERSKKFKIYVSALTQLNIDEHTRVSTTDNRLLRRIVRDYQFRGTSALKTIAMWPSVQRGAENFIFKYQNSADEIFNSALDYEIPVLRFYAEPLLRSVPPNVPEYAEASRMLDFVENFSPIPPQFVPSQSILREFIGESEFKY